MTTVPDLQRLIQAHLRGGSLAQPFYQDPGVFEVEADRFLSAQWIIAGHVSEIPNQGDYFLFEALNASVIVVRAADRKIHALHNVCRHRGARICDEPAGHTALLRCRYHGWTYRLDGELAAWRHMPEALNKRDYALQRCGVTVFEGLILVSLKPQAAPDPAVMLQHVRAHWARFDLSHCKVASSQVYRIAANWKLGVENNLECYHCLPSHPEYTSVNAFVRADEKLSPGIVDAFTAYQTQWRARMAAANATTGRTGLVTTNGQVCRAGVWPLAPGHFTGSRNGEAVAPLLGNIAAYDESVTTGCFGFLSYIAAMCDYAIVATYIPQSVGVTHVVMRWLVRADAVEGRDYDLAKLRWLWDETTQQDKNIIELNAAGVASRGYAPGPYSQLESMTADFVDRYLALMAQTE